MRIIVCIKQIGHIYARTGMDPDRYFLAPEDKIYRVNPYDEVALELALRLKERQGQGEIMILTLGPIIAEAELRRCLAMGAQTLFQIDAEGEMDPWRKSGLLAQAIKDKGADLILCGKESLDRQNGQVGAFMAHQLGMPFVSAILDLTVKEGDHVEVLRSSGRGVREKIECPLPAVFSVDVGRHEPRLPTYEERKKAQSIRIQKLTYFDESVGVKTLSTGVFPPRPRPKRVLEPDSRLEAFDRTEQLLTGSRVEKKGATLRGSPESQADGIVSFLKEHGFLKPKKVTKKE